MKYKYFKAIHNWDCTKPSIEYVRVKENYTNRSSYEFYSESDEMWCCGLSGTFGEYTDKHPSSFKIVEVTEDDFNKELIMRELCD